MLIGLLIVFTLVRFNRSLHPNYKEPIKCENLNNQLCKARPTLVLVLLY